MISACGNLAIPQTKEGEALEWKRKKARSPKGILIVYEGISGSGKSEGIREMKRELEAEHFDVTVVEWNANAAIRSLSNRLDQLHMMTPRRYSLLQWIAFLISYSLNVILARWHTPPMGGLNFETLTSTV